MAGIPEKLFYHYFRLGYFLNYCRGTKEKKSSLLYYRPRSHKTQSPKNIFDHNRFKIVYTLNMFTGCGYLIFILFLQIYADVSLKKIMLCMIL